MAKNRNGQNKERFNKKRRKRVNQNRYTLYNIIMKALTPCPTYSRLELVALQ